MKLCFITSSRADFGLIKPVIDEAKSRPEIEVQLIVTGTHLSKEHGYTVREIKDNINAQIEMLEHGDTTASIIKSMGNELIGLSQELDRLKPDLMVITGDRYEMLVAASACLVARIPVAHIYGGDITEGAFDDAIRHAITKMSHLHFASNDTARHRIVQMGELPETVFNTGSPSLDKIESMKFLSREELQEQLKIKFREFNLLITFHPETLSGATVEEQAHQFIAALEQLDDSHTMIITMPNADPENGKIRDVLERFASNRDHVYLFESLGYLRYFSLLKNADMVIGNSSSGLYEAPSFKIPTVNIGDRQKGRIMAASVVNTPCFTNEILHAIREAKTLDCQNVENPYGKGGSAKQIIDIILATKPDIRKRFYDLHNS